MKKLALVLGAILVVAGLSLVGFYNNLIAKSQGVDNQWAQVETQYQRRFDLIPNLVKSVEGIMKQEQAVFSLIAEARTKYSGAVTVEERVKAATQVESALGRLLVVMENYPELRSSENVTQLMDELAGSENRIAVERRRFNDLVKDYNVTVKKFPANLIAGILGFQSRSFFEASEGAENAPEVDINP
ncbi:MAG TPA: LemA family protein [Candidatus Bathyarchaeia archaeon]|nr:LemA family protein [Candidatus Bathyarchaeia archaeon]